MRYVAVKFNMAEHWYPRADAHTQARVDEFLHWQHLCVRKPTIEVFLNVVSKTVLYTDHNSVFYITLYMLRIYSMINNMSTQMIRTYGNVLPGKMSLCFYFWIIMGWHGTVGDLSREFQLHQSLMLFHLARHVNLVAQYWLVLGTDSNVISHSNLTKLRSLWQSPMSTKVTLVKKANTIMLHIISLKYFIELQFHTSPVSLVVSFKYFCLQ